MKIQNQSNVKISYTLRYDNAQGEIIESLNDDQALEAVIGQEDLLDAFETKILGLSAGDTFEFVLEPEQAYGHYDEEAIASVPEVELLDGMDPDTITQERVKLEEGMIIPVTTDDGEDYEAIILEIKDGIITLDFNHPLSGETLHFSGKIVSVQ